METLKDLTAELIIWLDSECPAVAPPLEPYDNSDLSHNFCELLRIRLDEINRLRSQVEQEPPKGKVLSPEEILSQLTDIPVYRIKADDKGEYITKSGAIKAMKEYHSQFGKVSDEESKGYLCSVCHKNPVDAENGYDTCPDCVSKI